MRWQSRYIWAGQVYMHEWGWDGNGYTPIHMHGYIAQGGCVYLRKSACLANVVYTQEFVLHCDFATKLQQCCHYCIRVVKKATIEVQWLCVIRYSHSYVAF